MNYRQYLSFISFFALFFSLNAKTIYVNNLTGKDSYDGLLKNPDGNGGGPLYSIQKAFDSASISDNIEIENTKKPYRGGNYLRKRGGTPQKPMFVNGNEATISGLKVIPVEKWDSQGDNIYRTPFWAKSNILRGWRKGKYKAWVGSPQIWWINGQAGKNCLDENELRKTKNGFWWNKKAKELWINLPRNVSLKNTLIQIPVFSTAISVSVSNVVVEGFKAHFSWNDGFDASGTCQNITFKNCIATDNCGQGFSVHDTAVVMYEDCLAMRNASSGTCNIGKASITFKRCIFADNTFEAGIFGNFDTQAYFYSCLVAGNGPFEQIWLHRNAKMFFKNCVITAKPGSSQGILQQGNGFVMFKKCTITEAARFAYLISSNYHGRLQISQSIVANFSRTLLTIKDVKTERVTLLDNIFWNLPGIIKNNKNYNKNNFQEFNKINKNIRNNVWKDPKLSGILNSQISDKALRKGARLPASVWKMYKKYKNEFPKP